MSGLGLVLGISIGFGTITAAQEPPETQPLPP